MKNPYQVFHSRSESLRENIDIVLVRPEQGANVGSVARAISNMGMKGTLRIVGSPNILNADAFRLAKHARARLENALHFETLSQALAQGRQPGTLSLAASARVGSTSRAHPMRVRNAMEKAISKLRLAEITQLRLVFGPESDGLMNAEVDQCDWVVTIPSTTDYRSINLAQAVLIFSYEANLQLMEEWEMAKSPKPSQRERLVLHFIKLAEASGFILPGDPFKMKPRLEEILSALPPHLSDVNTLHGLLDQAVRSLEKVTPDYKGRYRKLAPPLKNME